MGQHGSGGGGSVAWRSRVGTMITAVVAAAAALGLAIAHLAVNLRDFPADGPVGLLLGWVIAPAVLALAFSWAAIRVARLASPSRITRITVIVGALVMWLLLIISLFATFAGPGLMVLRPDGPGLWALIGAPAFTALIIRSRPARPVTEA